MACPPHAARRRSAPAAQEAQPRRARVVDLDRQPLRPCLVPSIDVVKCAYLARGMPASVEIGASPGPPNGGPQSRLSSPPSGVSTLMTRAPRSPKHHRCVRTGQRARQVDHHDVVQQRCHPGDSTICDRRPGLRPTCLASQGSQGRCALPKGDLPCEQCSRIVHKANAEPGSVEALVVDALGFPEGSFERVRLRDVDVDSDADRVLDERS